MARCNARTSACAIGSWRCAVSLCASPKTVEPCIRTQPTGTSSRTAAARARRSACSIPARSCAVGVPLRNRARPLPAPPGEGDLVPLGPDDDDIPGSVRPLELLHRQRVLQATLDHPLDGARPVDRIVPLGAEELLRGIAHLQGEPLGGEHLLEPAQLELDDLPELDAAELAEDDHLIDAVEKLGAELLAELLPHRRFDLGPRLLVRLGPRLEDVVAPDVARNDDDGVPKAAPPSRPVETPSSSCGATSGATT